MKKGIILLLNGTSSSGKSTLAQELQEILEEPFVHISRDNWLLLFPRKYHVYDPDPESPRHKLQQRMLPYWAPELLSGMRHCVAALATVGDNVVVDDLLLESDALDEYLTILQGFPVVFVGLHCSLDELERREQARGDRDIGLAREQFEIVHASCQYDIEIDTSEHTPQEAALLIKRFLGQEKQPTAFDQLRSH